jgi:hypothetical protein
MAKKKITNKKSPKGIPRAQMASSKADKLGKVKLSGDEKEELKAEGELPEKKVRESENKQLIWFFAVVIVIFAAFLVPYFWIQGTKTFTFDGKEWNIEEDPDVTFYHTEFLIPNREDTVYQLYLRTDPRKNDVHAEGEFNVFKYGGYFSFTEEVNDCNARRWQIRHSSQDLISFIRTGIGIGNMDYAASTPEFSEETGFPFVNCLTTQNSTVIMLTMGEPSVIQSDVNPNCYIISVKDCDDIEPIEKFIIKTLDDSVSD